MQKEDSEEVGVLAGVRVGYGGRLLRAKPGYLTAPGVPGVLTQVNKLLILGWY